MKKLKKEPQKLSYNDLSISELENEINRENYKHSFSKLLKSTLYILIIIIAISSLLATIIMPVVEMSDSTMKPLLNDGDIIITLKNSSLKQNDIIAFYHGNKILVKRVIGTEGDYVNIDISGNVYVNGELLNIKSASNIQKGENTITFPIQVSSDSVFVLSDERDNLSDSRTEEIGCIKKEDIIGKVIFRIWPIKKLGTI